jgi:hypothetical protein
LWLYVGTLPALAVVALITAVAEGLGAGFLDFGKSAADGLSDKVSSGPAISVVAIVERDQSVQGETWILPEPLSPGSTDLAMLANPFGSTDGSEGDIEPFRSWMRGLGGADPGVTFLKLIVEGQRKSTTLRIVNMKADVVKRTQPLTGTLLLATGEGGGAITELGFNLDENEPIARTIVDDGEKFGRPYFGTEQTKTLARGEQEVFQITAKTTRSYVEWCVEISLLIDGKVEAIKHCPSGLPARTSAFNVRAGPTPENGDDTDYAAYRSLYSWTFEPNRGRFHKEDPATFTR